MGGGGNKALHILNMAGLDRSHTPGGRLEIPSWRLVFSSVAYGNSSSENPRSTMTAPQNCGRTRTYVCTYARMYVCTYVCMYVCVYVLRRHRATPRLCADQSAPALLTLVPSHCS
jgi:hypothetical protein